MAKNGFLERHGIVRNDIRKDVLYFALPALTIFFLELMFCADALSGFWGTIWDLIKHPQNLFVFPVQSVFGLALFVVGLTIMVIGTKAFVRLVQVCDWRN